MNGLPALVAIVLLLAGLPAQAVELAGVHPAEQLVSNNQTLMLNGAGIRSKLIFKVYVAALYVPHKTTDARAILDGADPWCIRLHLLRDLDAATLYNALLEGLAIAVPEPERRSMAGATEQLGEIMRRVGSSRSGDVIALEGRSDGLAVRFNGEALGRVPDPRFPRALLSVWLGPNPVDNALKKSLLGE